MSITQNIETLCNKHELTLYKLEKQLGLGQSAISKWSHSSPKVDNLIKVADFFQVSLDWLCDREIKKAPDVEHVKDSQYYVELLYRAGFTDEDILSFTPEDISSIRAYLRGFLDSKRTK